uniref:Uncharacterized protein n=1 Tax=Megaselia scalaris TaxID=36166 RepID=T1GLQ0_MEGSC
MEMDRWRNKVAVITGAGSGMGAACAIEFIKAGIIVIGIGRRVGRIEYVKNSMPPDLIKNFHPVKCDVIVEKEVVDTFKWIVDTFGGVDVLVNCAGIYKEGTLVDKYNTESYKNCLYICLMGAMFATREAYASMKARNAPGHIFYITSSLVKETGYIPYWEQADINIMGANVHGLRAMVETYRQEFREHKAQVKTTVNY